MILLYWLTYNSSDVYAFSLSRVTSSGPWSEVGPLPLQAVSVQMDPGSNSPDATIAVWAVGTNGDVLCRMSVSLNNPRVVLCVWRVK